MDKKEFIYFGLYDKTYNPNEKSILYTHLIPNNVRKIYLEPCQQGYEIVVERAQFPFVKEDGGVQNYFGWYMILPVDKTVVSVSENMGVSLDVKKLTLKEQDGSDLRLNLCNVEYQVLGSFNIAKTSDNWKIHIIIR